MTQPDLPLDGRAGRKIRKLTARESFTLTNYVNENYVKSGKLDTEFCADAETATGIKGLNARHIASCREVLGIISNRDAARVAAAQSPSVDLTPLEKRLDTAEAQIRKLFALSSENSRAWTEPTDAQILKVKAQVYENHPTADHEFRIVQIVRECFRLSAKGEKA